MRLRLSLLMFLQYAIPGAWVPIFSLYLRRLGFSATETGWCCAASALGALFGPLLWGQIADRWLAAQRCITLCAAAAGALLLLAARQDRFWPLFAATGGFWLFMVPILSLGTSLCFRNLDHPEKDFGPIRLWGTVGWMTAGWCMTLWLAEPPWLLRLLPSWAAVSLRDCLVMGGLTGFLLAAYAFTLPHTPPSPRRGDFGRTRSVFATVFDAPLSALSLLRKRSLAVLCLCLLGMYATMPFTSQMSPLVLADLQVPDSWIPILLTVAQGIEVLALAVLPILLRRWGVKPTLAAGMLAWSAALALLSLGRPLGLVVGSFGLHGIYICCFLVTGQMFVNRQAPGDARASAQALLQCLNGFGLLAGNVLVGEFRQAFQDDFGRVFLVGAIFSTLLSFLFLLGFAPLRDRPVDETASLVAVPKKT